MPPGPSVLVASVLDGAAKKGSRCQSSIDKNKDFVRAAAARLAKGADGDVERVLMGLTTGDHPAIQPEQVTEFLEVQRERLRKVAARNVEHERKARNFQDAVDELKQIELHSSSSISQQAGEGKKWKDYEKELNDLIAQKEEQRKSEQLPMHQEAFVRQIATLFGDDEGAPKPGGDDVEVVPVARNSTSQSLKCPIKATWLEDPVRNKVCKHVYSRQGVTEYLEQCRSNRAKPKCPVPGCSNSDVQLSQLEDDLTTKQAVRREKRRLDAIRQERETQASTISDDEDDEL